MIGLNVAGVGLLLVLASILMSFNTSIGGTRSDYDDGSGCLAAIGGVLVLCGLAVGLLEWWLS